MKKYPSIDLGKCNKCLGCIELAPTVFKYNPSLGYVEVLELEKYPLDDVEEAIKNCPEDCIVWEESEGTASCPAPQPAKNFVGENSGLTSKTPHKGV